jgi:hypothetical protein
LLSFIFRNIVFSKGYERKNKKIFLRFEFARRVVDVSHETSFRRDCAKLSFPNIITRLSVFAKKMPRSLRLAYARRCEAERQAFRRGQRGAVANSIVFLRIKARRPAEFAA